MKKSLVKKAMFAVCVSWVVVGCMIKPPAEGEHVRTPIVSGCEQNAMIENIDDGDEQILTREGRGGYLYTYADEKGSTISPSGNFAASRGGVNADGFAMRMKGQIGNSSQSYVGMGFSFTDPMGAYDASKYTGIAFVAKAKAGTAQWIRVKIPDSNTEPKAGICKECFNDFGINFKLTDQWTKYEISFADMKQEQGWGDPVPESLNTSAVWGIQWNVANPGAKFDVWIDEVTFTGCVD